MTNDHSLEELRRQLESAKSKMTAAISAHDLAKRRMHDKLCRESGLMGKIAAEPGREMIVHNVEFIGGKPWVLRGFKIKKDGSLGTQEIVMYVDHCRILERRGI